MRCVQLCGIDHSYPCCAETGDHVNQDLHTVCLDTGKSCGFLIAADSQHMPAEGDLLKKDSRYSCKDREYIYACRNSHPVASEGLKARVSESRETVQLGECCAAGTKVCETAADVHGTQCCDERSNAQFCNDHTVYKAYECTEDAHQNNDRRYIEIQGLVSDRQAFLDQAAGKHAGKADHGTDRQVNAAGDDDEGHAKSQDAVQCHMLCDHGQGGD